MVSYREIQSLLLGDQVNKMVDVTQKENNKIGISFILNLNHANQIKKNTLKQKRQK